MNATNKSLYPGGCVSTHNASNLPHPKSPVLFLIVFLHFCRKLRTSSQEHKETFLEDSSTCSCRVRDQTTGVHRVGRVCLLCDGTHPWQPAHSSSTAEISSRAVRALRATTRTSCPLPSHDATPLTAATPDPTTPASGPHHTPLSTGAIDASHCGRKGHRTDRPERRKDGFVIHTRTQNN